jgi:selenide,water dikinase
VKDLFENVPRDPNVLVGFGTLDDAGVYRLNAQTALVQTVDFITPVVDDPFAYGEIAVANALSDVYAMGGVPITALNVVCFPSGTDPQILNAILRGGLAQCQAAGVAILGGHTVDDPMIKFGLSVTGTVNPNAIWTNSGAKVGDVLILTKPLGIGVITTAIKEQLASEEAISAALKSMRTLNRAARDAAAEVGPNACTDVTGFGFLGHLYQLLRASGMTAEVYAAQVPLLTGALELARQGIGPGGTERNKNYFGGFVSVASDIEEAVRELLFDPQTSGGLLLSVAGDKAEAMLNAMASQGVPASVIGKVTEPSAGYIRVE